MNKFTKDQLSALDINRHIAVTANAGSGKTRILVARYIKIISEKIIDGDLNIEDIVAITFTKKAAAEMKARVIKELDSLIADPDNEDAKQLEDVRTNMIYSRISTIHSFCGQILRDFPIEANVPFNYQELDDFDIGYTG